MTRESIRKKTEVDAAVCFPLAEEFYAITLPDGRVLNSNGELAWPLEAAAEPAEGQQSTSRPN